MVQCICKASGTPLQQEYVTHGIVVQAMETINYTGIHLQPPQTIATLLNKQREEQDAE
jgi:hypothetical protein